MRPPLQRCVIVGTASLALGLAASAQADGWGQPYPGGGYYGEPPAAYYPSQWGQPGPTVRPLPGPVVRPLPGPVIGPSLHGQGGGVIIYGDPHGRDRPFGQGRPLREERSFGQQPFAEDHSYRSQRFSFDRAYGDDRPVVHDRRFPRQSYSYEGQQRPFADPAYGQRPYHGYDRGAPVAPIVHPNAPVWVPNSAAPIYYGY